MESILVIICLLATYTWYLIDRSLEKKPSTTTSNENEGSVFKCPAGQSEPDTAVEETNASIIKAKLPPEVGRVYYSTPGRSFMAYIWNGRIFGRTVKP